MKFKQRCIPLGSLPYESIEPTTRMMAKLFEKMPHLVMLPKISDTDTLLHRTLDKIPGIKIKDKKITLKTSSNAYLHALAQLDKTFNNPTPENLEQYSIDAPFLEKFLNIVTKFKSQNACVHLLGPFTISQMLYHAAEEQILADKSYRKLFIQALCVKALWAVNKIKEACPTTVPVIILEEPLYGQLGNIKRENEDITVELVTNLFSKVIEKIKESGAIVGVECMEKCDWKIPINAGVDIISFDAYNNPNNLCIIPDNIIEFISRGGMINWGIIPTISESIVKSLNIDYIANRLFATMEGLILAGVPEKFVYNSALVSIQGDAGHLPIIFAEKALILSGQLAKRIPVKS